MLLCAQCLKDKAQFHKLHGASLLKMCKLQKNDEFFTKPLPTGKK